jgi:sialate O-acetylesterase
MILNRCAVFAGGILLVWGTAAIANVTMNRLFASNMVLQHGMPVPVWGTANAGENVSVQFNGQTKSVAAGTNGAWRITLDSMAINTTAQQMTIRGANTVTLTNVLIGDVWYCTGQSNMEFNLSAFGYNPSVEAVGLTSVRLLTLTNTSTWSECSPSTAGGFSAVAFFYGKYLHDSLNIPLGLICSGVGATFIWQWMSPASVTADGDPALASANCPSCGGDTTGGINGKVTSGLFRRYIEPTIPLAIRGSIWYQGEWDANDGNWNKTYLKHLQELIAGWRSAWNIGNFPFYYVQLPNFHATSGNWPLVRESERLALKSIANSGMAIAIDIGDSTNIHPPNKRDVGFRLALVALEKTYGHSTLVGSGPLFKNFYVRNDTAHLSFDYTGTGLVAKNGALTGFEIAPTDSNFVAGSAIIRGNEVLAFKAGSKVVNVRYAWAPYPSPTVRLYNQQNLPASPFRTYASDLVATVEPPVVFQQPTPSVTMAKIVSIRMFDLAGRCVSTIHGDDLKKIPAGNITMNSLARFGKFTKGVYIIKMQSIGAASVARKVVQH